MIIKTSCDDGSVYDLKFAKLLTKHELDGIFYIPVNWRDYLTSVGREPMSLDQFLDLASKFEIGSHTITHRHLTSLSVPEARKEIVDSRKALQDLTGQPINSFCYPRGYSHAKHREMVEEAGYTNARGVRVGRFTKSENPFNEDTTVHVYNGRKEYPHGWLNYARNMLKMAKQAERINAENSGETEIVYHLWLHGWEVERDNLWEELDTFLGELALCKSI